MAVNTPLDWQKRFPCKDSDNEMAGDKRCRADCITPRIGLQKRQNFFFSGNADGEANRKQVQLMA